MRDIGERIAALEHDRVQGASSLAVEAVRILADAASTCPGGDAWERYLAEVVEALAAAKPVMAGVRNAAWRLLARLLAAGPAGSRIRANAFGADLIAELGDASACAAAIAARLLPAAGTVATCSYSSGIVRTLRESMRLGKKPRVVAFEPSSKQPSHGQRLIGELGGVGVEGMVVDRAGLAATSEDLQMVLVGADAVTPTHVVNGAPSLSLARLVEGRAPFNVVCETWKFTRDVPAEPGYDRVPMTLVARLATENGVLSPEEAARQARVSP